ncbi:MAG TPA: FkbM family methyltransferase [Pelobium sp.]|nr:FkbM family methyltransferase [Pelobium sp.]
MYTRRQVLDTTEFKSVWKYPLLTKLLIRVKPFQGEYKLDLLKKFIYNPKLDIGRNLYLTGKFEDDEIKYSTDLLSEYESGTVLDIGANVGLHVITWAQKIPSHNYYAFEPTKFVHRVLIENIKLNNQRGNIITVEKAVSNQVGISSFYETSDDAYNSLKDTKRKSVNKVYDVQVTTIDNFINENNINDLRFVKIDTEGFEDEVIDGAKDTIRKFMPTFFIEIYKGTDSNINAEKTIRKMIEFGYHAYVFKDNIPTHYYQHNDKYYNYFFSKTPLI